MCIPDDTGNLSKHHHVLFLVILRMQTITCVLCNSTAGTFSALVAELCAAVSYIVVLKIFYTSHNISPTDPNDVPIVIIRKVLTMKRQKIL